MRVWLEQRTNPDVAGRKGCMGGFTREKTFSSRLWAWEDVPGLPREEWRVWQNS